MQLSHITLLWIFLSLAAALLPVLPPKPPCCVLRVPMSNRNRPGYKKPTLSPKGRLPTSSGLLISRTQCFDTTLTDTCVRTLHRHSGRQCRWVLWSFDLFMLGVPTSPLLCFNFTETGAWQAGIHSLNFEICVELDVSSTNDYTNSWSPKALEHRCNSLKRSPHPSNFGPQRRGISRTRC